MGAHYERGMVMAECSRVEAMPDITFSLGGGYLSSGTSFTLKMTEVVIEKQGEVCLLGIMPSGAPLWILGDVFTPVYYVKFDWTNNKLGIARSAAGKRMNSTIIV